MSDTREKILELADTLIRKRGFNAFSYKDISTPLNIKNAAVHYHFLTKAELGASVIERDIQKFKEKTAQWKDLPEDKQVKKLFNIFHHRSRHGLICLMGSLAPDFETLPEPMQEMLQEMSNTILTWLTACLERGRDNKRLHFDGKPYDRALLIMSGLLSSLLMNRMLGKKVFDRMTERLIKDLI